MRKAKSLSEQSASSVVIRAVTQFSLAGILAVVVVGFGLVIASRRVGEREAITNARNQTSVIAHEFIEPALTPGLARGDTQSLRAIDNLVTQVVLSEDLVRVKLWTTEGKILYSDEQRLIGKTFELGDDELAIFESGQIKASVSDLSKPENELERGRNKLLEVYARVSQKIGPPLLFEAYYRYEMVTRNGSRVWRDFAPISLGALAAVEIVQIPLAWSLARRLRQRQREHEGLLRNALDASDVERRRIASDLHDGVVQDLAGVALVLGGTALQPGLPPNAVAVLNESAAEVRESIGALRSLLVEIYPPNLFEEGLESALNDFAKRCVSRGVTVNVTVDVANDKQLPRPITALIYRSAQEAMRNVISHSQATTASVAVRTDEHSAFLEVIDNGVGVDLAVVDEAVKTGHFGLHALKLLVTDASGRLDLDTVPGGGTRLRVEVPLQ